MRQYSFGLSTMRWAVFCFVFTIFLQCCTKKSSRFVIGVSQCSEDIWRDKLNNELRMGTYFHDEVLLRFASADDSDDRQIAQIDSLVNGGIDLLIVAPNQAATLTPAIDRAYDSGIPVIVFDRKTNSQKFTAYIGADNEDMGRQMGEYVASKLGGHGRVLEIMGLRGSSPAIERHKGFVEAIRKYPGIELIASLQGDWTEQSAVDAVKAYKGDLSRVDFVFGQNDRMAVGARKALSSLHTPLTTKFCGIDGLPGPEGGLQCVRDSILDASYIYPTHGDEVLQLAIDILKGKPYEKENPLMAALVTKENASLLLMQNEETMRRSTYLERLQEKVSGTLQLLSNQKTYMAVLGLIILLLLLLAFGLWYTFRQKARINREREMMDRRQLEFYTQAAHRLRTPLTLIAGPVEQLKQQQGVIPNALLDIVDRNTKQLSELVNRILDGSSADFSIEASVAMEDKPDEAAVGGERFSLLVVDDNADIRTLLRTILQDHYEVNEAADGQQGLEKAKDLVPDLIISDVMMPVMNGLEFCQHIKNDIVTSHIPVILLTARALSRHQVEGYQSGADAYITKPFQSEVLLARICNLLRQRRQLRRLWQLAPSSSDKEARSVLAESSLLPGGQEAPRETLFLRRFRQVIEARMSDSDLGVEDIGAELNLSRVQLYRKVKVLTGASPVELLRKTRLARGRQLLETTDLTVSEVAYQVGFTAPSYFTKCFKEEFSILPGEVRNM